jgi:hypothetical protein
VSDKGGEFVVMKSNLDDELVSKHLENRSIYQPCDDLTRKAEKDINEVWEYVAKKNWVNERHINRLKSTHSICPVLYLLTKTHKFPDNVPTSDPQSIKVRPIISGCGGPADKISWLVQKICTPLLQFVKAHLKNTGQLIQILRKMQNGELKNKFLFSLDVVSLYPSVNTDAAIDTLRMYLEKEKKNIELFQFSIPDIVLLTKTIFQSNCFSWRGTYFQQQRGLAMGNRLAPILAILYMDRIENQAIYSDQSISFYYRYIDDCITPASSPNEAFMIQNVLNSQDPSIQFEIELPNEDGFLPFLNTKIKVNDSGTVETGWYTKPANKGLMLNAKSHHPEQIKRATIVNNITTYEALCSNDALLKEAELSFEERAIRNGYNREYVQTLKRKKATTKARRKDESKTTLTIPFISRSFTNDIRRAVQRSNLNVRIVQQPQASLKNLLVESRPYDKTCKDVKKCLVCRTSSVPVQCSQKDTVYQVTCNLCGAIYIGETSRPLVTRFQEHYRSASNPTAKSYQNMAFSKHYNDQHPRVKPNLSVKVLKKTKGSLQRKITEALFIQKLKPDLNGKYEQLGILDFVV